MTRTTHLSLFRSIWRRTFAKALGVFFHCLVWLLGCSDFAGWPFEVEELRGVLTGPIEVRLDPGVELTGRLTGLVPEELSEVNVLAWPQEGGLGHESRVGFGGGYRITGLTPGVWRVEAAAEGQSAWGTVHIRKGETRAVLDLEFAEGHTLSGVLLRGGDPLSGIALQMMTVQQKALEMVSRASTSQSGRFRFRGLEPGEYRLWGTDHETGWRFDRRVEVKSDLELRIEVWSSRVTGTVVDARGAPVASATVDLYPLSGSFATAPSIVTGEDGRFVLPAVDEGAWRLVVQPKPRGALVAGPLTRVEEIRVVGAEMDLGMLMLEDDHQVVVEPR